MGRTLALVAVWALGCGSKDLEVGKGPALNTASVDDSGSNTSGDSAGGDSAGGDSAGAGPDSAGPPPADDPLELCVDEWVASNVGGLRLADGKRPDWLELRNNTSTEVSLAGWVLTDSDDLADGVDLDPSLSVPADGVLVLFADGEPHRGAQHLELSLDAGGESIGLFAPDGQGEVLHYGEVQRDMAIMRTTPCCSGGGCWTLRRDGSPGAPTAGDARETLIALGSSWRYIDTNELPDPTWVTAAFNDSAWALGDAPLGFGDTHLNTVVASGPEGARNLSTWFRQEFYVEDAHRVHDLELDLMVDDGARVWINGDELLRINLPTEVEGEVEVNETTLASAAVSAINETAVVRYAIDGATLVEGGNVVAVEVHQATASSSDLGLDAQLTALRL